MNKHSITWIAIMLLLVVSGCASSEPSSQAEPQQKSSEEKPTIENETQKQKLSISEVLEKTNQKMVQIPGFRADLTTNQSIDFQETETKTNTLNQVFNVAIEVSNDPTAFYMKTAEVTMDNQKIPNTSMEMYKVDNMIYFKDPRSESWVKSDKLDLSSLTDSIETPLKTLDRFQQILEQDKNSNDLHMSETGNEYVVELQLDERNSSILKDVLKKRKEQLLRSMQVPPNTLQQSPNILNDITFEELNERIWIDKETFQQKKFEQHMKLTMSLNVGDAIIKKIDQTLNTEITEINKKVMVPEEVKSNAKDANIPNKN